MGLFSKHINFYLHFVLALIVSFQLGYILINVFTTRACMRALQCRHLVCGHHQSETMSHSITNKGVGLMTYTTKYEI